MSTRCSIWYGSGLHVYEEAWDDDKNVYVEAEHGPMSVNVAMPVEAAIAIGEWALKKRDHLEKLAAMTDEEIERRCEQDVDKRIDKHAKSTFLGLPGLFKYGGADLPRDVQISNGREYWSNARADATDLLTRVTPEHREDE